MITNTNGIAESIYHYIWLKDDSLIKESFQLRLPDTILFKNGMPQVWYFTNQSGEILMKKNDCRKPENIINHFCNNSKQNGQVIAYYIYNSKYNVQDPINDPHEISKIKQFDVNEKICIYYLTKETFPQFIKNNNKAPEGILQKFIDPIANHEQLIQAIWSPSVCILSKKQNNRDLYDMQFDPYERCATFDGCEAYSKVIPLRGKQISHEIRKQCQMIIQKLTNLSYGQTNISRVVMYFKPDKQNRVWFLYCTSIRLQGEPDEQIEQYKSIWGNSNIKKNNTPISFNTNFKRPHQIKNVLTVNTMHPVTLIKNIECVECGSLCQKDDLYHLAYEFIIKHFELNPNSNPIINENILVIKPKSFFVSQDHIRDIHSHIPPLIIKLYPQITVTLYEQMKVNDAFLIKTILVCESCFLKYSSSNSTLSGASQRVIKQKNMAVRLKSASILQRKPEIKEYLFQQNLDLIKQKKEAFFKSNNNKQSFNSNSQFSTALNTHSASHKYKLSLESNFDQISFQLNTAR
ncbi:unnamed protein product [Paramecium pentaurelia]|uniref:Uncharacterized protein n=1 Tax=Paramecium pentaurelia TaxID=43138 RepID=A0A8S1SJK9_9CILI|nr:unnamed protein product [Paramecium pentaurelia]